MRKHPSSLKLSCPEMAAVNNSVTDKVRVLK
jgi:hypothetical protein